jgi:hypothetical protein
LDASGEDDHPHSHPETKDAGNPNPNEKSVFVTHEKPKGNAGDEAYKSTEEEGVVDFVKHGRSGPVAVVEYLLESIFRKVTGCILAGTRYPYALELAKQATFPGPLRSSDFFLASLAVCGLW